MDIKNIAVVGSGTMGNGIAHVFALNGYDVLLMDIREEYCEKALKTISKNLDRQVEKNIITEKQAKATLDRIEISISLEDCKIADIIVEAVTEDLKIKQDIFATLDKICKEHTIFGSNTSSLSITQLAASTTRPEKFIGMHFMNPVPVMKLVEVIRGLATDDKICTTIVQLA
ncbi:MAG: 3-hydroxyacyl-CoA dehydrogenase NAD-binding domain-containing protein, partial [Calditrichia bacterium]